MTEPSQFAWLAGVLPGAFFTENDPIAAVPAAVEPPDFPKSAPALGIEQVLPETQPNAAASEPAGETPLKAEDTPPSPTAGTPARTAQASPSIVETRAHQPLADAGSAVVAAGAEALLTGAARSFERAGLTLLSVSAAAKGSTPPPPLEASVGRIQQVPAAAHPVAAAASVASHPANSAAESSVQAAVKDLGGANAAPAQSASTHAESPAIVKAGTTGESSKNGTGQDAGGKPQNPAQSGNTVAAVTAGAVTSASAAVQAASSGFPAALSQAAQATGSGAHAGSTAQSSGGSLPAAGSRVAGAMDGALNTPGGVVSSASVIQTQGRAEMRVALQTDSMGTLQLHAVVDGSKIGASIAVVSHEAHTLLTNELPALQQVLTDQNLRVDRLAVINSPMMAGSGAGDNRRFHSGDFNQPRDTGAHWYARPSSSSAATTLHDTAIPEEIRRRLSVRA